MTEKPIKTPALVLIEWRDAAHEFGWMEGNEQGDDEPELSCFSTGWLLKKKKTHIKICQTYSSNNHAQTLVIPAGMILAVTTIKPATVRNVKKGK